MAATGDRSGTPLARIKAALTDLPGWLNTLDDASLGEPLIEIRGIIDRSESVFADGVRRFDTSGEYQADGALSVTEWLRGRCKLSGGAAAERVEVARQLANLPKTEAAFANGDLGYQHVVVMARAAEHVGAAAVRKAEGNLLKAAQTMDPGRFTTVAKGFEHQVDAVAALADANHAYQRRYFHISEPKDGMVRLDGILDLEGGATLKTALGALMPPPNKDDDRTPGQRSADALVDLARRPLASSKMTTVGSLRPHLVITASAETLAGIAGAPPAQLEGVGPIPMETAQRHACDPSVSWLLGQAEMESETSHAHQRIPAATRRALVTRDRDCVFNGCHRPPIWCDGHHLIWWTRGGKTELPNLALVCGRHHRMLHEEGWTLVRHKDGRFTAIPPPRRVMPSARSA